MFEGYTEGAQRAIAVAEAEARGLGHDHVGTEHLLLGLVADTEGPAGQAFARLGITVDGARQRVVAEVRHAPQTPGEPLVFTPRARGTLDAAPRQALGLKDDFVGTEHILLALLIERDARTASILSSLGCPPDLLRETVLRERGAKRPPDDGDALLELVGREGVAARALAELGVSPEALREAVARARGAS